MPEAFGAREKKLLIAIQVFFKQWSPDGGTIPCELCWDREIDDCDECHGQGGFSLEGSARDLVGPEDYEDALLSVWTIFSCREHSWTPVEYLSQTPKWLAAFHFATPFLEVEYEMELERRRKQAEQTWRTSLK